MFAFSLNFKLKLTYRLVTKVFCAVIKKLFQEKFVKQLKLCIKASIVKNTNFEGIFGEKNKTIY